MFGSTSRFCFEGGRISSRSTGTPRDTRKRRRILLLVQLGGCIGGGETSCCQRERARSERNGEELDMSTGGREEGGGAESGNMVSRYGDIVSWRSDSERSTFRSSGGCGNVSWWQVGQVYDRSKDYLQDLPVC